VPNRRSIGLAALASLLPLSTLAFASEAFRCVPAKLKVGDKLVLAMQTPHGGDLALRTPKGDFFFLVFRPSTPAEAAQSLVPWDTFKTMAKLTIPIGTLKLVPWATNAPARFVFDEPGTYLVLMDENLEGDAPARHVCRVHFHGRAS
jgi:hypothetical protein